MKLVTVKLDKDSIEMGYTSIQLTEVDGTVVGLTIIGENETYYISSETYTNEIKFRQEKKPEYVTIYTVTRFLEDGSKNVKDFISYEDKEAEVQTCKVMGYKYTVKEQKVLKEDYEKQQEVCF